MNETTVTTTKCGTVALVGRPNVGKSTLLNRIVGQKVSITSRKPQTTRHRITGIHTEGDCQTIFVDTPGIQQQYDSAMHRYMNKAASSTFDDVDVIVFLIDRLEWSEADQFVCDALKNASAPVLLVINKVDRVLDKNKLLPYIQSLSSQLSWADIVPLSAKSGQNVDRLQAAISQRLPHGEHIYDAEQMTDRSIRFLSTELIREKIMRQLGDELPHKVAVEIERFDEQPAIIHIDALIWVERDSQKKILIGKQGERIKAIGIDARRDIEFMCDKKVMLKLWVKVKSSWSDDDQMLRSLGYSDEYKPAQ